MIHPRPAIRRRHDTLLVAAAPVALALALGAGPVQAAINTPVPSAPPPSSGSNWSGATIDPNYSPTFTVNSVAVQAPRAYAEWQQFNVTAGSVFNVQGQNPDWILVNRVVGVGAANISDLSGTINAEGQVWLINPNGIVASQTGVFNVGGLLLSTATGFDTAAFLSGSSLTWTFTGATQPIVMNGTVVASHGVVALLAPQITVGDGSAGIGTGNVFETEPGQAQFVAIAAEDVSLTFAEDGNLLYQLDGATIQKGVAGSGPGIVGGVLLNVSSTISVGRIFVAAAGQNAPANVLLSGSVTATEARVDGDDIVLMVTDFAPAGSPQVVADVHVLGGPNGTVDDQSVTSGGGYVLLAPQNVNTIQESGLLVDESAALGAGVTVRSAGTVILGDVTNPVGDLDIKANGNIIPVFLKGNLSAVDIALESGGDITTGSLNARDDVVVRSQGGFTAGDVNAGVTVLGLSPTDPTTTIASEAGERLVGRTQPMVFIGHSFDLVGHNVDVIANHIDIGAATASDDGLASSSANPPYSDVRLQTFGLSSSDPLNGAVVTGALTAPRDVLIDAFGNVSATDILAGRDFAANSVVGDTAFASADVGDDIVLGAGGAVIVSGDLTTHGQDSAAAGQVGDLLAASGPVVAYSAAGPGGSGGTAFGVTGSDIDILSGSIRIGGASLAQGDQSDARFQAQGAITLQTVNAGEDILIDAGQGVVTGTLTAGRDIAARSFTGSVTVGALDAQDDIVLRSGHDASSGAGVTITGAVTTHGANDAAGPDQSGDLLAAVDPMILVSSFTVAGGSDVDILSHLGGVTVSGLIDAAGGARLQTGAGGGGVRTADVTAENGDILLDGANVLLAGSAATNVLSAAKGDVAVRARTGAVTLTSASAGDDITIRAGANVTVSGTLTSGTGANVLGAGDELAAADPIRAYWAATPAAFTPGAGSDIDVRAGGPITLSGLTIANGAGSDIRLDSGGAVTVGTLRQQGGTGGEQVLIAATDLTLGGQIDAPGADVLLFARRTSLPAGGFALATLGGPAASGAGFTFDNSEVSRTRAASLNLFSGADPAATSNVVVQDLQFTATLRTIRVYAGQGSRIDVTGQVTDPAGTDGVFVIGAAATDPNLAAFVQGAAAPPVSAAWAPDVIRLSGGIGVTGNALSRVSFAAPSIYIAPTDDSALGADFESASQSQAPEAMAPYVGPATLQLRAGRLELRASNAILERNLQTTTTLNDGRGLELGGISIDRLSASGSPAARVSLFGRLDSHLGGVLPPPPSDTFIDGIAAAFLLRFAPEPGAAVAYPSTTIAIGAYRFNKCNFGGGGCFQEPNPGGGGDIIGGIAGTVLSGPSAANLDAESEAALPGIANSDLIGEMIDPFAPIEEEPVTNAGGEIEWPAPSTPERPK